MKNRVQQRLDELIDQLSSLVDRAFREHVFNQTRLKFDSPSDRKTEAIVLESQVWGGHAVPPCPVCGVNPHNWAIHEEWRRLPGAKSEDKVAVDREAYREVYPAHECVDRPTLPCPACLKWTGDGFASVKQDDDSETAMELEAEADITG